MHASGIDACRCAHGALLTELVVRYVCVPIGSDRRQEHPSSMARARRLPQRRPWLQLELTVATPAAAAETPAKEEEDGMSLDEDAVGRHLPDEVLPHSQARPAAAAASAAGSAHYAAAGSPSSNSRKRKLPPLASLRTVAKWEEALEPLANTYPCTANGLTCRSAGTRGACMILAIAKQSTPVQHRQFENVRS
jgi:hypothetical protein